MLLFDYIHCVNFNILFRQGAKTARSDACNSLIMASGLYLACIGMAVSDSGWIDLPELLNSFSGSTVGEQSQSFIRLTLLAAAYLLLVPALSYRYRESRVVSIHSQFEGFPELHNRGGVLALVSFITLAVLLAFACIFSAYEVAAVLLALHLLWHVHIRSRILRNRS